MSDFLHLSAIADITFSSLCLLCSLIPAFSHPSSLFSPSLRNTHLNSCFSESVATLSLGFFQSVREPSEARRVQGVCVWEYQQRFHCEGGNSIGLRNVSGWPPISLSFFRSPWPISLFPLGAFYPKEEGGPKQQVGSTLGEVCVHAPATGKEFGRVERGGRQLERMCV